MQTLTTERPGADVGRRPRSRWLIVIIAALVLGAGGVGLWLAVAESDIQVAEGLADDWIAALNVGDVDTVAALYTEDGSHTWGDGTVRGREAVGQIANSSSPYNMERTGDLVEVGDARYKFPIEWDTQGQRWEADVEIWVDEGLIEMTALWSASIKG